jgi:hypothetical protein
VYLLSLPWIEQFKQALDNRVQVRNECIPFDALAKVDKGRRCVRMNSVSRIGKYRGSMDGSHLGSGSSRAGMRTEKSC